MRKGTQRRLAIGALALTAIGSAAAVAQPASAFPPGHRVYRFNYRIRTSTRMAKLGQTIAPPLGTYTGGVDMVTGAFKGGMKLPPVTFAEPYAGLSSVTAQFQQVKPVTGHLDLKKFKVTETSTFLIHIVSAYTSGATPPGSSARSSATLPTLPITLPTLPITLPTLPGGIQPPGAPPVNLVGDSCLSATPIKVIMHGIAKPGSLSELTGTFTMPSFTNCGPATELLNALFPAPGNTFSAVAAPSSGPPPPTLPTLPITLPTLPVTLPTLPVTLPTLPVTLPTLPATLPTLPITLPTLPVTLPSVP